MPYPKRYKDLTGKTFNFLTVLEYAGRNKHRMATWKCRCVCGVERVFMRGELETGNTKSCGCKWLELHTTHGHTKRLEHQSATKTYRCWHAMKHRCSNSNNRHWKDYGGRGIKVCDRWLESFENFLADMGENPDGMSLDRIDNNLGYSKENCRWIPMALQQQNRRNNRFLTVNGETKCIAEWARIHGLNRHLLRQRIERNWTESELFLPPDQKH